MKRHQTRLSLDRETIRQLATLELKPIHSGVGPSVAPNNSCSQCFAGCHTGDSCP